MLALIQIVRAFVTGADGFVGQWLVRELQDAGYEVHGGSRAARMPLRTLDAERAKAMHWHRIDLTEPESLRAAVSASRPDAIFHLAAQSNVPASIADPAETFEVNLLGTVRLLDACRREAPDAMLVVAGSADVYGIADPSLMPLREDAPLRPANPYAGSKAAAEVSTLQYARSGWVRALVTRSFNHTGPGQSDAFAAPAFAKQLAAIKAGAQPPVLRVGNLEALRDFLDVRDVVTAYRLLAERGGPCNVYNVCSGTAVSMRQIVDELVRIAGVDVRIEEDPARMRPSDTPLLIGDASALQKATGWMPTIPLDQTLTDLLASYL
ncbi:MAG TPA: GDP-mannose 4,6-dehydratase [Candidatus Eremiobacteraceae bacterium]|jgi:GDP-4-dehydro-6-deoxy-D-mannose reductase